MVSEAKLEQLPEGLGAEGAGWFVLNARDARWWERQGLGAGRTSRGTATSSSSACASP